MSIYVDPLIGTQPYHKSANERWNWRQSCHMFADTHEELHAFAAKLGLRRAWFQSNPNPLRCHYDLTANKRLQAIRLGAIEITHQQMAARLKGEKLEVSK